MAYTIISELYNDTNSEIELVLCCDSVEETIRVYDTATHLGYLCFPNRALISIHSALYLRILIATDHDRLVLKLAL